MTKLMKIATRECKDVSPKYTNGRGEIVECEISYHARRRFQERFVKLTGKELEKYEAAIINLFNSSYQIGKKGTYKSRNKKHGGDSLYFQNIDFVFVVQNKIIKTVEIVTDRDLN